MKRGIKRWAKIRIFMKSPVGIILRLNKWIWNHLPRFVKNTRLVNIYGLIINYLVRLSADRNIFCDTFFFRNRPKLEMMRRLCSNRSTESLLKITVCGCSNGAEVYSIIWTLRSTRPDLRIEMHGLDISEEILRIANKGEYFLRKPELMDKNIFAYITDEELNKMFEKDKETVRIRGWLKEGITWHHGDAGDPEIIRVIGPQDIVVASNFLCHLEKPVAESCLRNIIQLVAPGGYLFVSGVDIDVRMNIARELRLIPQEELMKEIHDGDPTIRNDWPFSYWGLEPMNADRKDRALRYAAVFQVKETN